MSGEIDAVFTWVDGNDPAFQASKALHASQWTTSKPPGWETRSQYTGEAEARERPVIASHSAMRFRDKEELRFALRSVHQFAPWIRRIYIVTNGQVPAWLDAAHPRISVVPHSRLFEEPGALPTFNSNAIEATIHRIPGLSDDFIYFNDDFFFGRPVTLADFIDPAGRHRLFVEKDRKMPRDMTDRSMIAHNWAFNHTLMNDLIAPSTQRRMFAHTPQIYNRHILAEIQLAWREDFRRTLNNRFRTAFDAAFRPLYTGYAGEGKRPVLSHGGRTDFGVITGLTDQDYLFIKVGEPASDYRKDMNTALEKQPLFFCVNDDLPDGASAAEEAACELLTRNFLLRFFPDPSPFEKIPLSAMAGAAARPVQREPLPAARLAAGRPVAISRSGFVPDVRAGWYETEEHGAWSNGPRGRLDLRLNPAELERGFRIGWSGRVLGSGLTGGRLLKATLQLGDDVEGARITEFRMESDDIVSLAADAPTPPPGWRGEAILTLERMITTSPSAFGFLQDRRRVSLFVGHLELLPPGEPGTDTTRRTRRKADGPA